MILLAILPFLFTSYVKGRISLASMIIMWIPSLRKAAFKAARLASWIHEGMKRSDNFRKFFRMLIIIVLLLYTYTEYCMMDTLNEEIVSIIHKDGAESLSELQIVSLSMIPYPGTLVVCLVLTFSLYFDRWADRLFSEVHASRKLQCLVAVFILMICAMSALQNRTHHVILAEVLYIILGASWAYPSRVGESQPKGRRPVPSNTAIEQSEKLRQAA